MGKEDKLLRQMSEHLHPNEQVDSYVTGQIEVAIWGTDSIRTGLLAATNERLLMFAKKLGGFDLESFPYDRLSSFEHGKNLMGGTLSFHASGNNVKMKWINTATMPAFVDMVRERMHKKPAEGTQGSQGTMPSPPALDIPGQIAALAALRDQGILTEEEFTAKKIELLSKM